MWKSRATAALVLSYTMTLVNCGEVADPDVITRNDLKAPSGLKIVDKGNGSVQLRWTTANFEDNFEGYNVYGAAIDNDTLETLGVVKGEPIQLLNSDGEPIEKAKSILGAFTYESKNEYALPGTADNADATYNTAELKFSTLPFHKLRTANKEANLPSCKPLTTGVCTPLGNEKEETEPESITSIGIVSYDLPQTLEVGQQVCFFVFSVQDEGEEISQSSSNVACIIPKFAADATSFTMDASGKFAPPFFNTFRENCSQDETSFAVSCDEITTTSTGAAISESTETLSIQFERYGNANAGVSLSSGKNTVILSFGYFPEGFTDPAFVDLVSQAPVLTDFSSSNLNQTGGYSQPGQSISLQDKHIYVIANALPEVTPTSADFYYDWLFAESVSCVSGSCTVDYKMLFSKNPNSPGR